MKNFDVNRPQTFCEYFNLGKAQDEIDFLDIYANQDIPLFLDPYGISVLGTTWARECESQIATYFQYLLDSIQRGDKKTIQKLLNALHEVNEVALGYSQYQPEGRGIGPKQAKEILDAFESSQAAKSGDIKDIADCALLIPGINRDKISDITSNILKRQLILFTQEQCKKHTIPMKRVAINNAFNYDNFEFTSFYTELPVLYGKAKILLPISSVRQDPELSKDKYYRNFVLEFLRAEHCHSGDSLAYVLKNGTIKVNISDLKKKYPLGTDFLYSFSKEHPRILDKYKDELRRTAKTKTKAVLDVKKKILSASDRIAILNDIKPGNAQANDFHKLSYDNLIHIFGERFSNPDSEVNINEGRKRIDIVFDNNDLHGFFFKLNNLMHVQCPKIFVECKNYGQELGNPEIDQLQSRFGKHRGSFGILMCRKINDKAAMIKKCKDILHDRQGYVVVLEDSDIINLLRIKDNNIEESIDEYLGKKINELIM